MVEHSIPTALRGRNIILGSQSPRRRELLGGLNIPFTVKIIDGIDESFPATLPIEEIPMHIASQKASAYLPGMNENDILITADTIVEIDNTLLGKPVNRDDAISMLHLLAGRTHRVITGVCITATYKAAKFSSISSVDIAALSHSEIEYYVDTFEPYDKAGAYGIQEWFGYVGVERISGSFYNVMGLPVQRLYRELIRF
ncbi:MAG: Maf family nucleotide pyrophosphatase [Tannerellaceae bacterium]|jgi:septum formation protein|nr:Maf family nucleotide pyrophosphatase [Tannerellaceae bacterium]